MVNPTRHKSKEFGIIKGITDIDSDATHNPESIATVVDLMDKYNMGYCSVNHNRNRCLAHEYT